MSKQICIPDGLYSQLSDAAIKNNVSIETLVAKLLESALPVYDNVIRAITQAYAERRQTPYLGDWSQVEEELKRTKSPFESLEAAMDYARGRP